MIQRKKQGECYNSSGCRRFFLTAAQGGGTQAKPGHLRAEETELGGLGGDGIRISG